MERRLPAAFLAFGIIGAVYLSSKPVPREPQFEQERFDKFAKQLEAVWREVHGCEKVGYPPTLICSETLGHLDAAKYRKLGPLAHQLWPVPSAKMVPEVEK